MKKGLLYVLILFLLAACSSDKPHATPQDKPETPNASDKNPPVAKEDLEDLYKQSLEGKQNVDVDVVIESETEGFSKTTIKSKLRNQSSFQTIEMMSEAITEGSLIAYYVKEGKMYADMDGAKIVMPFEEDDDLAPFVMTSTADPKDVLTEMPYSNFEVTESGDKVTYTLDFNESSPLIGYPGEGTLEIIVDRNTGHLDSYIINTVDGSSKSHIAIYFADLSPIDFPDFDEYLDITATE